MLLRTLHTEKDEMGNEKKFKSPIFSKNKINFSSRMNFSRLSLTKNFTIYIQDIKIQAPFYSHYNNSDIFFHSFIL